MTGLSTFIALCYLIAASLFIVGLKYMSSPATARRGNTLAALGMLIAIVVTLLNREIISFTWIIAGIILGSLIGVFSARPRSPDRLSAETKKRPRTSHPAGSLP